MSYADVSDPNTALANTETLGEGPKIEEAIAEAGLQVQVVNWIWEQVTGSNLVESIITPITGDFEKIGTTGKQWENISEALQAVRDNLNGGLGELDPHWDGEAAQKFSLLIQTVWTVGIEVDAQAAKLIGTAFEKVAEASKKACELALKLIKKLINKLIEAIALIPIPIVGWARAVKLVVDAIEIYNAIMEIIRGIQQIIEGCQTVIQGVQDLGTALSKIQDVRNLNDAINSGNDLADSRDTINEGRESVSSGAGDVRSGGTNGLRSGYRADQNYGDYRADRDAANAPPPSSPPSPSNSNSNPQPAPSGSR
ncbi:WXG100 family type VII secretion target [Actinokineospora sp.]|uniref:WXG100 family type VII secretion target n=1 Tax=Actinokineospora sp. TaxID=1872133 RepID=UPI004037BA22